MSLSRIRSACANWRFAALWLLSFCGTAATTAAPKPCEESPYQGFDSRLKVRLVGRLPQGSEPILDFEVVDGRPLVVFSHRLLGFEQDKIISLPSLDLIQGVAVDDGNSLLVQTRRSVLRLGESQLVPVPELDGRISGQLFDSGNPVLLDATIKNDSVIFRALRRNGQSFPVAAVQGHLRAASWNQIGLAAVVEETLLAWEAGGRSVYSLAVDSGLRWARDACLVGPCKAVVMLDNVALLITPETTSMIAAIGGRCRWYGDSLYLLDQRWGAIVSVEGLEQLGRREEDHQHALDLIHDLPLNYTEEAPQFLEAARIIGCDNARALRSPTK